MVPSVKRIILADMDGLCHPTMVPPPQVCPLPNPKPVPANRPNLEAKRPPKPLIITSLCKLNTKSCLNQVRRLMEDSLTPRVFQTLIF